MPTVKTAAKSHGLRYEETGTKEIRDSKHLAIKMAKDLSTSRLIWLLVSRHKVGLLAIGNIVLVLNWAIPAWPEIVRSLFA